MRRVCGSMPIVRKLLTAIVGLFGVLFVFMGLQWLVDPLSAATDLGLMLDAGVGLSSQVGDFSAFFLTVGLSILCALVSFNRVWYYPAIALLVLAAIGRIVAWVVHDATLALDLIAPEIFVAFLLVVASRILPATD